MLRAIQRHRDVFQDYSREFRRTKVRTVPYYIARPRSSLQVTFLDVALIPNTLGECPSSRRPGQST